MKDRSIKSKTSELSENYIIIFKIIHLFSQIMKCFGEIQIYLQYFFLISQKKSIIRKRK